MNYDVRCIRFIKSTADNPIKYNESAEYIALGHFDMIHIDRLGLLLKDKESNEERIALCHDPLRYIGEDRSKNNEGKFGYLENCVYSLYILLGVNEEKNIAPELDKFWNSDLPFTIITRIHCDDDSDKTIPFRNQIITHCRVGCKPAKDNRILVDQYQGDEPSLILTLEGAYCENPELRSPVQCVFYDSLELGDIVAVMKSKSLASALEIIRYISLAKCVKDTYTYCGIQREILQAENMDQSKFIEDAMIPSVAIRFSIRSNTFAHKFFNKLPKNIASNQYYITGTADHARHWNNCKEIEFLRIVHAITQLSPEIHLCFNDIITRLGLDFVDFSNSNDCMAYNPKVDTARNYISSLIKKQKEAFAKSESNKQLYWDIDILGIAHTLLSTTSHSGQSTCLSLHINKLICLCRKEAKPQEIIACTKTCLKNKRIKAMIRDISIVIPKFRRTLLWLSSDIQNAEFGWKYTFRKLLGTLKSMYENYVMDDLAKLLIPSVNAFVERINYIRDNRIDINNGLNQDIITFLNEWTTLTNDISQLESQLSQHPELNPVRCYIPAMILQIELKFVERCCQALSDSKRRSFHPLLLPTNNPKVHTICPLDPEDEKYSLECPLIVYVPVNDLYRPWEISHRICHEIAHYCQSEARNRNSRYDSIAKCAAMYIQHLWYREYIVPTNTKTPYDVQRNEYDKIANSLCDFLAIDRAAINRDCTYKTVLKQHVIDSAKRLVFSQPHFERYISNCVDGYFYSDRFLIHRFHSISTDSNLYRNMSDYIGANTNILLHYCSECYSDIAMILLLNCNIEEYYQCVYKEEYEELKRYYKDYGDLDEFPLRANVITHIQQLAFVIKAMASINEEWEPSSIIDTVSEKSFWLIQALEVIERTEKNKENLFETPLGNPKDPHFLLYPQIREMDTYFAKCAKDINNLLASKNQQELQRIRNLINDLNPDTFGWEGLQKFLQSE